MWRFVLEHPTDIDLRKVDQLWFLDYVESDLDASYAQTHLSFFWNQFGMKWPAAHGW